jgi:hypothetical protein
MRGVGQRIEAAVAGDRLLELPVRLHGILLGRPVELLVDPGRGRAIALEVVCGDERHRLLPLAAATIGEEEISISSALLLADAEHAPFYRERTSRLATLRGTPVARNGRPLGTLGDVVVGANGQIEAVLVESRSGLRTVACETGLQVGGAVFRC